LVQVSVASDSLLRIGVYC